MRPPASVPGRPEPAPWAASGRRARNHSAGRSNLPSLATGPLTYLQFHLAFTLPVLVALALLQRRTREPWWPLGVLVGVAFVYTTPWDNYLVARAIWTYPPEAVLATVGYVPVEEYAFFVIQTVITGLWTRLLQARWPVRVQPEADLRVRAIGASVFGVLALLGVACLVGLVDPLAQLGTIIAHAVADCAQMILGLGQICRIRLDRGFFCDLLGGSDRDAVQNLDTLCHHIDMLLVIGIDGVEQLVHGDEVPALHVPMSLLDRHTQRQGVGKPCVQFRNRRFAGVILQSLQIDSHFKLLPV